MRQNHEIEQEQDTTSCLLTTLGFCASFISNQPSVGTPPEREREIRASNTALASVAIATGIPATIISGPATGAMACAIPTTLARINSASTQVDYPPRTIPEAMAPCITHGALTNTAALFSPAMPANAAYMISGAANISMVTSALMGRR